MTKYSLLFRETKACWLRPACAAPLRLQPGGRDRRQRWRRRAVRRHRGACGRRSGTPSEPSSILRHVPTLDPTRAASPAGPLPQTICPGRRPRRCVVRPCACQRCDACEILPFAPLADANCPKNPVPSETNAWQLSMHSTMLPQSSSSPRWAPLVKDFPLAMGKMPVHRRIFSVRSGRTLCTAMRLVPRFRERPLIWGRSGPGTASATACR